MRPQGGSADEVIGALASLTHGVVTREQLLSAGITPAEIKHRLRTRALLREHRSVYRVGHRAWSLEAHYLAAVLACGDRGLLCGAAGTHLYGLHRGLPPPPEVLALTQRRVAGVTTHRVRHIDPRDATRRWEIPVTTVPRTLVDVAPTVVADELARMCHEAGIRYRVTPDRVEAVLARRPNSPAARKLRWVLRGGVPVTLSRLEERFLVLLEAEGLPLPETNQPVGESYVDCRWTDHPLTVELDSYRYHNSRYSWERDRRREREAYGRREAHRRYTYGDVYEDPALMLTELHDLLRRR